MVTLQHLALRKTYLLALLSVSFLLVGCQEEHNPYEDNPYKDFEKEQLTQLAAQKYEAILNLAQASPCIDATEWKIAEIDSVCGISYLAYHQSTDERRLQELIKDYNLLMEVYIPHIAPLVDCMPQREVLGVACVEGRAVVEYRAGLTLWN